LTPVQYGVAYLGVIAAGAIAAFIGATLFHYPFERIALVYAGCLYVVASTGRPAWLYQTLSMSGLFGLIESDRVLKFLLVVLGVAMLVSAAFTQSAA
jgi:membrane associated rhomboid family serine protease